MSFSLRNRIAFLYIVVTGIMAGLLFLTIYGVVYKTVYHHIDEDLNAEASEVEKNLVILNDEFVFANPLEWDEKEHGQIEVNPVFIQVVDTAGKLIKKTGNLLGGSLSYTPDKSSSYYFSTSLSAAPTRQLQVPIKNPVGKILGFVIIAIPLEESAIVLENLSYVMMITFPIVLIGLFFSSRFIAGKSIAPLDKVIKTTEKITKSNLEERIELPPHNDEIFVLTSTINGLLDRLEDAVLREKQFTSDASHELRTPLSVIKGTLEVLIRKPRDIVHYESKIKYCISEVDRMSNLIEQLLLLARYESGKQNIRISEINPAELIQTVVSRINFLLEEKEINLTFEPSFKSTVKADSAMLEIIFENILSNAVKYSENGKNITIDITSGNSEITVSVKDEGIGMTEEQTSRIFDRFYRIDESRNSKIYGNGLGLAIVKKLASLQGIALRIKSEKKIGTTVSIVFPEV